MLRLYITRTRARAQWALILGLAGVLAGVGLMGLSADAAPSSNINFQARLLTSTGAVVPDGNYNIEFKLYDVSAAGTELWTETRLNNNSQGVRVVNGYMSVNLGSVTAFPSTIKWNDEHWLTMNIGNTNPTCTPFSSCSPDGEMSPRIKLTALPFAFQAGELAKSSGTDRGTLSFNTVANDPVIVLPDESGTVCTTGSICSGYQAAGSYFVQGGNSFGATAVLGTNDDNGLNFKVNTTAVVTLSNTGAAVFKNSSNSANAFQVQNSGGNSLFTVDTSNTQISLVRSIFSGNILPLNTATIQSTSLVTATADSHASDNYGRGSSVAIGTDGLPIVAYEDATNAVLRVLKCGNLSCSSSNTSVVAASPSGGDTDIAIAPDGLPVISHYSSSGANLRLTKCGNTSCSSGNTTTDVETTGSVGHQTSIAISTDGLPIIAHYDVTNTNARVVKCGNATCSSGNTATAIDVSGDDLGSVPSIAIAPDGLPVLAYSDLTNTNIRVTKCGNVSCSSGNTTTAIDVSVDNVGDSLELAIGADGLPVVAYNDATNTNPRVLKCSNASCSSSNTITAIDTGNGAGQDLSISVGTDGMPVIASRDVTTAGLRATKCGNLACSSGNTNTTLEDSADLVGEQTSMAVGTDGLPIIFHYDSTNDDLRVARCGNTACSSSGSTLGGGIELGSQNTSFQNAYLQNIHTVGAVNPLTVSTNGAERLRINGSGEVTFKNSNSTTGFQIQNSSATPLFVVDSVNNRVYVGNPTGDTTGTLLVVDNKTDSGDPTGVEGAIYYNSNSDKFRCFQASAWTDCISAGASTTLQNAYDADADGSDSIIELTDEDDSIIFRNPSANGTDSTYILTLDQLSTGAKGGLDIQSAGTGNLLKVTDTTATARDVFTIADGGAATFRNQTDSTSAFQIQNAAGNSNLFIADTSNTVIKIGTSGTATQAGTTLFVTAGEFSGALRVGDGTDNAQFDGTTSELSFSGAARHTRRIMLEPEYGGAALTGDGSNNTGTMSADNMTSSPYRNYYMWTTSQVTAQDYDVWIRVPVPTDFSAMPTNQTICFDVFSSTTSANTISLTLYDTAAGSVALSDSDLTPSSASTWQSQCTSSITGGTYAANGVITMAVKLTSPQSGDIRISTMYLDYLSKW